MKKMVAVAFCLFSFGVFAIESEMQLDNDQVRVFKMTVDAHEEIGLHRDEYPQVVVALKGGTITRLEANGSKTDVEFPKGVAVYREADPAGELHRSVNNGCKPIELIIVQLK
ncbi:MAG TPA: hypothetical protein VLF94_01365 [Chlamydiales bacterium]|nr:hypothetical protein [Chlamydiales bacterium]